MLDIFEALRATPRDSDTRIATLHKLAAMLDEPKAQQEKELQGLIHRELDLLQRWLSAASLYIGHKH